MPRTPSVKASSGYGPKDDAATAQATPERRERKRQTDRVAQQQHRKRQKQYVEQLGEKLRVLQSAMSPKSFDWAPRTSLESLHSLFEELGSLVHRQQKILSESILKQSASASDSELGVPLEAPGASFAAISGHGNKQEFPTMASRRVTDPMPESQIPAFGEVTEVMECLSNDLENQPLGLQDIAEPLPEGLSEEHEIFPTQDFLVTETEDGMPSHSMSILKDFPSSDHSYPWLDLIPSLGKGWFPEQSERFGGSHGTAPDNSALGRRIKTPEGLSGLFSHHLSEVPGDETRNQRQAENVPSPHPCNGFPASTSNRREEEPLRTRDSRRAWAGESTSIHEHMQEKTQSHDGFAEVLQNYINHLGPSAMPLNLGASLWTGPKFVPVLLHPPLLGDEALHSIIDRARINMQAIGPPNLIDFLLDNPSNTLSMDLKEFLQPIKESRRTSELLATYWVLYLFLRWYIVRDEESYQLLPPWLRPTYLQLSISHPVAASCIAWPGLRDEFIRVSQTATQSVHSLSFEIGQY
uniref:BZIP domain-containing protein n=1 Tax=Bionectria ochroleuca TaxID=29856 RepID=A0A8H7TTL7_BIOOC